MTERTIYRRCHLSIDYNNINKYINNKFNIATQNKSQPLAIIMVGGPGSGKSTAKKTIVRQLGYDTENFITIDPDEIISSLFQSDYNCKAEMNKVLTSTYSKAWKKKYNIIIDKTGKNFNATYNKYIDFLKKQGYQIILCLTVLNYSNASTRIKKRNRGTDNKRALLVAKKTYTKLNKIYEKYIDLDCDVVDKVFVYDNKRKLRLAYKSICDNNKKIFTCYSISNNTKFLRNLCTHKKYIHKKQKTKKNKKLKKQKT